MRIKTATISGLIADETRAMTPLPTGPLFDDLFVIQDGFANVFLIRDNEKYIAIDAGINPVRIEAEMARLGIAPNDVKAVLVTHSDIDHVNGLGLFTQARVYVPEAEVAMLGRHRITMTETALVAAEKTYADKEQGPGGLFGDAEYWPDDDIELTGVAPHRTVSFLKNVIGVPFDTIRDGAMLRFDRTEVEAVLIDGHTKGLTAYIVNRKYIFVGDGMSLKDGRAAPFNAFLNRDEAQHRKSITKLKELRKFDYIFTQHYGYAADMKKTFEHWHA